MANMLKIICRGDKGKNRKTRQEEVIAIIQARDYAGFKDGSGEGYKEGVKFQIFTVMYKVVNRNSIQIWFPKAIKDECKVFG